MKFFSCVALAAYTCLGIGVAAAQQSPRPVTASNSPTRKAIDEVLGRNLVLGGGLRASAVGKDDSAACAGYSVECAAAFKALRGYVSVKSGVKIVKMTGPYAATQGDVAKALDASQIVPKAKIDAASAQISKRLAHRRAPAVGVAIAATGAVLAIYDLFTGLQIDK